VRDLEAVVVHARNTGCWFDALVAGLRCRRTQIVLGFHGFDAGVAFTGRQRRLARWGVRLGALFTTVSQRGRRQLHAEAGVPLERIEVLANGVDLRRFPATTDGTREQARRNLGLPTDGLLVGTVGSLTPVKGVDLLLTALARTCAVHRNLYLVLIGEGPQRAALLARAGRLGIRDQVIFAGARADVPAWLGALDIYACASRSEGASNALLEALAAGCPIVTTDVGDHADIVRTPCAGLVVPPEAPTALSDALIELARRPQRRAELGAAARRRAQAYDFAVTARDYERFYERLTIGADPEAVGAPMGEPDRRRAGCEQRVQQTTAGECPVEHEWSSRGCQERPLASARVPS